METAAEMRVITDKSRIEREDIHLILEDLRVSLMEAAAEGRGYLVVEEILPQAVQDKLTDLGYRLETRADTNNREGTRYHQVITW